MCGDKCSQIHFNELEKRENIAVYIFLIKKIMVYKANQELAAQLLTFGLLETSSKHDKSKGKRRFKKSRSARKEVCFDHKTIVISNGSHQVERLDLSKKEVNCLFLYFDLTPYLWREINAKGFFNFKESILGINRIEMELMELMELKKLKLNIRRQIKLSRIIDRFKVISTS